MKFNYITLAIFLLIILLCCVTMIYQYKQNLDKNEIITHQPDLFELQQKIEDKKNIREDFEDLIKNYDPQVINNRLLITDMTVVDKPLKMVKISGKNLEDIIGVYFGDIKTEENTDVAITTGDIQSKFYLIPNLNDPRFSSIINYDDIISLEIKLLIFDGANTEIIALDYNNDAELEIAKSGYKYTINDPLVDLVEKNFEKGFSKEFKITLNVDFKPFRDRLDNVNITYRTKLVGEADPAHKSIYLENNKSTLKLYDFYTLEELAQINDNNFITVCQDNIQRKIDPELDKLCKKKYDDFTDNITTTLSPSGSSSTINPGITEPETAKLKILLNGIEYELSNGENILYFRLDRENYKKEPLWYFKDFHIQIHPEYQTMFDEEKDFILQGFKITAMNNKTEVLIPSGLYLKPGLNKISTGKEGIKYDLNSWRLELKKKQTDKGQGGSQLVDSVNQFYQDTLNIITPPAVTPPEAVSYAVRDFSYQLNPDTREYEFTWKPPLSLEKESNLGKFFYYFTFEPTSGDVKDTFKYSVKVPIIKEQSPTETQSKTKEYSDKITFSYDRLLPLNEYKYSFMVSTNKPQIKILDDSQTEVIQFRPDGLEDYHTHLFDPVTGKFKLEKVDINEIKRKQPELMQTYYQMVAYNQRVAEDEIRNSQLNMADSTKCVKGHTNQFMYGDMGSAFTENLKKFLNENNLKEGPEFTANQQKQEEQLESIQKKLEELEEHHNKKVNLHDLKINTLKSLQDGSLIRIEEIAGEKKLIKLNDGCVAYNKNLQYGAKDDYGYVPCNMLDTEQHFTLNKINNLDEYNYLLSSNLKPRIDPNEDNKFQYPFYTLQPTDSVKCVNVEDGKFQIRPCEDSKSVKFQGFFNKDECNV